VSPENRCGPVATNDEGQRTGKTTSPYNPRSKVEGTAAQLRVRRAAGCRLPPLACGRRDPLDPLGIRRPSTFGLTSGELRSEANRLAGLGWAREEVTARLAVALRREVTQ